MRKWIIRFLLLIASVIVGFLTGYAAMSFRAVAVSPIGLNLARTTDPLTRAFVEMARLGEAETAFRTCENKSNPFSQQAILRVESELIGGLRIDATAGGLTPPLDIAEAILDLRSSGALRSTAHGHEPATVSELIRRSGWAEGSEGALREALTKLDGSCK
jgi:hypothetical protein